MNTYIVSDIHGCNKTFRKALKSIRLKKKDTLIILGDLIDRGPDSKGVLDTVFLLLEHGFNVISIRGNHEQMFLDSFEEVSMKVNWMKNGGKETLKSFLTSDIERIPKKYVDFIKSTKLYLEIDDFILVHAGVNMNIEQPFSDVHSLLWLREWEKLFNQEWLRNRRVIHGHTPMSNRDIISQFENNEQIICIDNGSYMKNKEVYGAICVLKLDDLSLHFEKRIDSEDS